MAGNPREPLAIARPGSGNSVHREHRGAKCTGSWGFSSSGPPSISKFCLTQHHHLPPSLCATKTPSCGCGTKDNKKATAKTISTLRRRWRCTRFMAGEPSINGKFLGVDRVPFADILILIYLSYFELLIG